jgi:hypothetical protein
MEESKTYECQDDDNESVNDSFEAVTHIFFLQKSNWIGFPDWTGASLTTFTSKMINILDPKKQTTIKTSPQFFMFSFVNRSMS